MGNRTRMLERAARLHQILPPRGDLDDIAWGEKIGTALTGQIIQHIDRTCDLATANKILAAQIELLRPLLPPEEAAAFNAFKLVDPNMPQLVSLR